ncbi:MAG: DUF547 domain-containing protein [Planctomycetota bacterium]|nr:DUF547 domain-containing protein [Planctomycetota bacterium]
MGIRHRFLYVIMSLSLLSSGCFLFKKEVKTATGDKKTQEEAKKKIEEAKTFSHELWNQVLTKYCKGGFVDYEALKTDRKALDNYLELLSKYNPKKTPDYFKTREEKLAYWMNAYNALVFQNVTNRYAADFNVLAVQKNFFYQDTFNLGGDRYNLYDIENKIVREEYKDPRIHFALNCASFSCPRLPEYAFTAKDLEKQLEAETKKFLNELRNCEIDAKKGVVTVSKLFEWYQKDFLDWPDFPAVKTASSTEAKIVAYINHYRAAKDKIPARSDGWTVEFREYNWKLNKQGNESGEPGVF